MKKLLSILTILLLLSSCFSVPTYASENENSLDSASIIDDMNLISEDSKPALEARIAKISETYHYNITLVSAGEFSHMDDFYDYVNSYNLSNLGENGIIFTFGLFSANRYEWDYVGYGKYSDTIGSAIIDYMIASEDYAEEYSDYGMLYVDMYTDFVNNVENYLVAQTGIEVPAETLNYVGEGGMLDGFDPLIDSADILTPEQELVLFSRIESFQNTYDFDITLLTMSHVPDGDMLLTYCDYYEGLDPTRDGLVFALNMNPSNRGYATSTRNLGEVAFTSSALDIIDEEIAPILTSGEYFNAFNQYLDYTEEFIVAAQSGDPYSAPLNWQSVLLYIIAIPAIFSLIITMGIVQGILVRQMKTAVIQTSAEDFLVKGSLVVSTKDDKFINKSTSSKYSPKSKGGGGGSGGSSRSGYGGSRGGRSGSF